VLGFELNGGKFGCYAPPFGRKALARALRLHGAGWLALVADRRRGLRGAGREAHARHARDHAHLAAGAGAAPGLGAGPQKSNGHAKNRH